MVDPASFGSRWDTDMVAGAAAAELIPVYVATRDGRPDEALARPVNRETIEALEPPTRPSATSAGAGPSAGEDAPETAENASEGAQG